MSKILVIAALLAVTACSRTLPVHGDMNDGKEKFLGQATGYLDGEGKLIIRSEEGTKCEGAFKYTSLYTMGEGDFACNDGRHGTFDFTSDGNIGRGFGKTNLNEPFRFTFGHPSATIQSW